MRTLHTRLPDALRRPARRRRIAAALVAAWAGTLAGLLTLPASGGAATLQARSAAEFRDSVGVQTHFPFTGYPYDAASTEQLAGMLKTVGIRHLRDDLCFNTEQACARVRTRLAAMRDALGPGAPKVDLLAGYTREIASAPARAGRDADIERALTAATTSPLAPMLAGLEPVNEPDLKGSAGWETTTLADDATFRRLLAEPRFAALRQLPVLSPAIGHPQNTAALFASGWTRARADAGNFHPYPPAWGGPENGLLTPCSGKTDALGCAKALGQGAPIATETGYSTSGNAFSTNWVSERAQGIYLPRLLLENFRAGVSRTYLYELVDLKPLRAAAVDGYGLWRSKAVGSTFVPDAPKPAALALARMNATIGDLGARASTGQLEVSLTSGGRELGDAAIRRVLLRRADGSYVLALWQPQAVWNNTVFRQAERTVPATAVDVNIGGGRWTIRASRPSANDATTNLGRSVQSVNVRVGADVTLLDLRSARATAGRRHAR
ncbi:MAG: hypothetical protein J7513_00880 [Solirubrobacteraceae bacterium]|nr:hypothetical protein [Solirubrobacteraceae bacterium]